MAFLHEFPYTDFHEINLDWIIWKFKQLEAKFKLIEAEWEEMKIIIEATIMKIGDLNELLTDDKETLVGAINEIYQKVVELRAEFGDLAVLVNQFDNRITVLEGDMTNLKPRVDALESGLTGLTGKVETLETGLSGLTTRVGTLETGLSGLTTRVGTLETNLSGITTKVGTLETNLSGITTRVGTLETDLTALKRRVSTNETDISTLKTSVANINNSITSINNSITSINSDITSLKTRVTNTENNIGTLSGLKTTAKGSLVAAINELFDGQGGGISEVKLWTIWSNNDISSPMGSMLLFTITLDAAQQKDCIGFLLKVKCSTSINGVSNYFIPRDANGYINVEDYNYDGANQKFYMYIRSIDFSIGSTGVLQVSLASGHMITISSGTVTQSLDNNVLIPVSFSMMYLA